MFEKYLATSPGDSGHGGEYTPQLGFGWTNGATLDVMLRFGRKLNVPYET